MLSNCSRQREKEEEEEEEKNHSVLSLITQPFSPECVTTDALIIRGRARVQFYFTRRERESNDTSRMKIYEQISAYPLLEPSSFEAIRARTLPQTLARGSIFSPCDVAPSFGTDKKRKRYFSHSFSLIAISAIIN